MLDVNIHFLGVSHIPLQATRFHFFGTRFFRFKKEMPLMTFLRSSMNATQSKEVRDAFLSSSFIDEGFAA
jgi:hypothetical protein